MAITFRANKSFVDYLLIIGFNKRQVNSEKKYFSNKKGHQIRIDEDTGLISFLNKYGYSICFANRFTDEQINKFNNKGEL